jgi:two-component system nitrate/nitrite response regulator NarL
MVAVIAPDRLYREGLERLLRDQTGLTIGGTVPSVSLGLGQLVSMAPDVVLIDVSSPGNLCDVRRVVAAVPSARVIALAVGDGESHAVACAEAGAAGYVTRGQSVEDLLAVIDAVTRGELLCSPRIAGALLQRLARLAAERAPATTTDPPVRLTAREREIVALIEHGMSNKEIARALTIEVATVKNHVHHILEKLNVDRREDAAARLRAKI